MASEIKILPDTLINQIAAGEVVERPASVVKELLENAVDAGGTQIEVEVTQAGKSLIRVVDNGRGMSREDLLLSTARHATSKIERFSDLLALQTMGFRGEALASIAAVSRLVLTSVAEGESSGWALEIWGGERTGLREVAGTRGTTVEVRDLFYNIPARQAFLKSDRAEWNQIAQAFERVVLGFTGLQFSLSHNGKTVFQLFPAPNLSDRLRECWGGERTADLLPVEGEELGIRVRGFVSPPQVHVHSPRYTAFIINRRWVRSPVLYPLLLRSFDGLLPAGRFPLAALWLDIPPELVDVNVHPTKQEVRFSQGEWVTQVVAGTLSRALKSIRPAAIPPAFGGRLSEGDRGREEPVGFREPAAVYRQIQTDAAGMELPVDVPPFRPASVSTGSVPQEEGEGMAAPGPFSRCTVIGQVHQSYILALTEEGLLLLDQHAVHERILYEKLLDRRRRGQALSQRMLIPITLDLPPLAEEMVEDFLKVLNSFGLELAPAGDRVYWMKAVPPELNPEQAATAAQEIAATWHSGQEDLDPESHLRSLVKSMACHGAIRAGQSLGGEEMRSLLSQLDQTENPSHCPHGRPLWFLLSLEEIEKRLKRR